MVGRESAPLIPVGCGLCPCSSGFLSGRSCGFRSAWRPRLSSRPWLLRVSTGVVYASVRPTHVSAAAERVRRWLCSQGQPIRRGVERDLWSDLKLIQTGGFWLRLYGEIGRTPRRDRSGSASRSVALLRTCCSPMVLRCGTRPSSPSSPCVPRRRVGRAELDRSRAGSGPISVWGVVVVGVAHGRLEPLRGGGWFLLESRDYPAIVACGGRAPMCGEGGLCTWERNRDHC